MVSCKFEQLQETIRVERNVFLYICVYIVHAHKCRVYIPMHTWKLEKDIRCLVHQECRMGVDKKATKYAK